MVIALLLAQDKLSKIAAQPAYASELHQPLSVEELKQFARTTAINHNIDPELFLGIATCESNWDAKVQSKYYYKGARERSFGIFQIFITKHTDVSEEQAKNPYFNITWAANNFVTPWNDWKICYKQAQSKGTLSIASSGGIPLK